MDRHERDLSAFLAGDLDQAAARAFDEHLLGCEHCWDAVRADRIARAAATRLRHAPPPELAERIRFSVELAAAQAPPRRRVSWRALTTGTGLLAAIALVLLVVLLPDRTPATPPPVAAVVLYARLLSAPTAATAAPVAGSQADVPVSVGGPLSLSVDGTRIELRYYRVGTVQVAIATADRPFPEPTGARAQPDTAMAWSATVGGVSLYCPSDRVLLAAPIPPGQLAALAARLPSG